MRSSNTRSRQMRRRVSVPSAEVRRQNAIREHTRRHTNPTPVDLINQAMLADRSAVRMGLLTSEMLTDDMVIIASVLTSAPIASTRRVEAMQVAVRLCSQVNMLQNAVFRDMDMVKGIEDKLNVATNVIGKMVNPKSNITLTQLEDCPICFEKIVGPKIVCQNGHSICNCCLSNMLKTTVEGHKCPMCRIAL